MKATIFKFIGLTCIVTSLLALGGGWEYMTGWLAGCGVNLVYFAMLTSRCSRALHLPPERIVSFIRGGAGMRILLICLVLILISHYPSIHFWAAVAGILSYRIIIIADTVKNTIHLRRRKEG
ncbi:MAG: ATP synthase subunit I [Megasphaera sp.]|nr:ATP synthase subunit I [Megasphaera sp.]